MANINKISVAGTIYDIQDQHASKTVELTQAEYDGLSVKDPNTYYIITDAKGGDLSNYYTKGETDTLLGEKQPTLVSGTNIKTINNESLLGEGNIDIQGGGGKAVNAGTNISITTGETADTINCTLPISNGTGEGSIIVGDSECTANGIYAISLGHSSDVDGDYSLCHGSNSYVSGRFSFAFGDNCKVNRNHDYTFMLGDGNSSTSNFQFSYGNNVHPKNRLEFSFGTYNNSSSATTTFGDSGNTMFSIGNGYDYSSTHNWHNAFEVRQNGDIYVPNTDDTSVTGDYAYSLYPMVRLQDTITATAANTTALGGLKLVKLTQSEYDALQTKDASTLYIIVN